MLLTARARTRANYYYFVVLLNYQTVFTRYIDSIHIYDISITKVHNYICKLQQYQTIYQRINKKTVLFIAALVFRVYICHNLYDTSAILPSIDSINK